MSGQQGIAEARVSASRKQLAAAEAQRLRSIKAGRRQTEDDAERSRNGKMLPTPQRKQHGRVVEAIVVATDTETAKAGGRVRRTQSPIERYASRDQLTRRQTDAAEDLRADWDFGIVGIKDGSRLERVSAGGQISMSDAQIDAATRFREAIGAIGKQAAAYVVPIVIGDSAGGDISVESIARRRTIGSELTAEQLAARRRESEKRIMGALALGLDILADHYQECGDKRRAAKYG